MIYGFFSKNKKMTCLIICWLVCSCSLTGCKSPAEYKDEADKKVYNIIDSKWQEDFGGKANYRISDVAPSPNDIQIEKKVPPSGVLTLPQAVTIATAYNRGYQTEKETLYLSALTLTGVRHDFEIQFFGGADAGYGKRGNDEAIGSGAEFGFNQLLATGTRISTAVSAAWVDVLTGNLRSGMTKVLSASIEQPLLRGSDRAVVLENLTQAERDALYQVRLFNRFRKTFVVEIMSQYYRVLRLYDVMKNARNNYDTLCGVYERAGKLAEAGRLPLFEFEQAEQDKLQAWDGFVQAEKLYKQGLDEFKLQLSLPPTVQLQLDPNELEALRPMMAKGPQFSEDEAIDTALVSRLDLANSADAVTDAERKVFVAADGLRADLTLTASTTQVSGENADISRMRRFRDLGQAGARLDLPLDCLAERNIFREAQITLNRRQREYEQATDTVTLEIRQAYRDLTEATERYKTQKQALDLAQKRFDSTTLLLEYRRANTRDVLDAQKDMLRAKDAATAAIVNYMTATLNFYRDAGVLEVRPDGMWEL